ncbi:MAG: T9SS type A sorting domain-containing protein [Ignavibacteria bacterium]|nr:T9SS type A sorting domain-containing protein [Ignavibacteria bacterium]
MFVYSLDKEEIIYGQSIEPIKNFIPGIISPPYIYYHQVKTITGVSVEEEYPTEIILHQNYPNPFNPSTTIEFTIPNKEARHVSNLQQVTLVIYDILGRELVTLVNEKKLPGKYSVQFTPGSKISSSVYFYQIKVGSLTQRKKMIFLK